tara:strand:- start:268 stop:549 length:282 start_codon:yes stop_codon:yes gene_type:complete
MIESAHLDIPGITDKGKLEELLELLPWHDIVRGHHPRVPGDLGPDSMPEKLREVIAEYLGIGERIPPAQPLEGTLDAGPGSLRDMYEEKLVPI